jgi:hypothetical protein
MRASIKKNGQSAMSGQTNRRRSIHIHGTLRCCRPAVPSVDLVREAERVVSTRRIPRLVVYEIGDGGRTVALFSDAVIAADVFGERLQRGSAQPLVRDASVQDVPRFEFSDLNSLQELATLSGYSVALMERVPQTPAPSHSSRVLCISDYSHTAPRETTGE